MSKKLTSVSLAIISGTALAWGAASCSSSSTPNPPTDGGSSSSSSSGSSGGSSSSGAGSSSSGGGSSSSSSSGGGTDAGPDVTMIKLDDMEGTGNGPNTLPAATVPAGESRAYWYNTSSSVAGLTPNPFAYTALPAPHTTFNGVSSMHGAYTGCTLTTQYGYCTEGVDFFQAPTDGGLPADAGPEASVPQTTVQSDISQYTGLTFWAMSGVDGGTFQVHTLFPDGDTDPRGGKCGLGAVGSPGYYQCTDDFQFTAPFGATWTQVVISLAGCSTGASTCDLTQRLYGTVPAGVFFDPAHVYGVKWQSDGSNSADAAPIVTAYWVDDVYFTK